MDPCLKLLVLFVYFISSAKPSFITTTTDEQYKDRELRCIEGEDCVVMCNRDRACQNSDIYCPYNHSCSISCTSATTDDQFSCLYAHIHCPPAAQCDVLCSGQSYNARACWSIDIEWPTTYPFNTTYSLSCNGGNSCSHVTIQAPGDDLDFTFECPGFYDCDRSFVICPKYAKCNILCSGWYACEAMTIIWPLEYSNANLTCGSQFSCAGVNFPIPPVNKDLALTFNEGAVYGSFVNCPKYANCSIECVNASSCAGMIINWPLEGMGHLSCGDQDQTCKQVNFPVPSDTHDLTLECHAQQCTYSTIFCPKHANCHIICNKLYSCWGATIFWPLMDHNSTLTCNHTANWACKETTRPPIIARDDSIDLYVNCSGDHICYGSVIYCPKNAECHVSCTNAFACTGATILWPDHHPYSLQCNGGDKSCSEITYKPYNDNTDLNIVCSGSYSCKQSTFFCPSNASCNILCDGSSACEWTVIHCPTVDNDLCNITCVSSSCYRMRMYGSAVVTHLGHSTAFRQVLFPIPPANKPLSIHCEGSSSYCVDSVIYCPKNASCNILCEDSTCRETTVVWPTDMDALNESSLICRGNSYPYDPVDCRAFGMNPPSFNMYHNDSSQDLYLICSDVYECAGAIVHCPLFAECHIQCIGNYSCNGAIFNWVDTQTHSLLCGKYLGSCKGVTFTPNNDIDFVLNCTAREQCRNAIMHCPLNSDCNIHCSEYDACNNAVIHGPNDHKLYVQCDGYQSCFQALIYAQNVSYFELNGCHALGSCGSISIWFPPNQDNKARAIINGAMDGQILDGDFYAIHGWKDVQFINYDVGKYAVPMGINRYNSIRLTMYCLPDYSKFCRVGYHSLSCDSYGDVTCDMDMNETALYNVTYLFGDSEDEIWYPTNDPTAIPTYHPTREPTTYPTAIPTVNPTLMQSTSTYVSTVVIDDTEETVSPTKGSNTDGTGSLLFNAMIVYVVVMYSVWFV